MASSRACRVAAVSGAFRAYGVRELFFKLKGGASAAGLWWTPWASLAQGHVSRLVFALAFEIVNGPGKIQGHNPILSRRGKSGLAGRALRWAAFLNP